MQSRAQILSVVAGGRTSAGAKRHNEDAFLVRPDLGLFAVADGAGGPNAGNVASSLGLAAVASHVEATVQNAQCSPPIDEFGIYSDARRLAIAVRRANLEIVKLAQSSKRHRSMASTIVVAIIDPRLGLLHLVHLGDSRCYRLRAGLLEVLTIDHSLLHDVLELRPETDDAALKRLPRQVITRALGIDQARIDLRSHEILPGDKYLLCSDGVNKGLAHNELAQVLDSGLTPDAITARLVDLAVKRTDDNVTAVVVGCDLAPGSRLADRPRPPSSPRAPSSPADPEVLMPAGSSRTDPDPRFSVLPSGSMTETLLDAKGHLVPSLQTLVSRPAPGTEPSAICPYCAAAIAARAAFCPHCGAKQPG